MYTDENFRTKKALQEAVASGKRVRVRRDWYPHGYEGRQYIEGPHYPQPHRWFAVVDVEDGIVVKVVK